MVYQVATYIQFSDSWHSLQCIDVEENLRCTCLGDFFTKDCGFLSEAQFFLLTVLASPQKQFSELLLKAASDYGALTASVGDFQWSQNFRESPAVWGVS